MFFTKEDFRKIEEYLKLNSRKDTDFPELNITLNKDVILAGVYNNRNIRFFLQNLKEYILKGGSIEFDMLSEDLRQIIESKSESGIPFSSELGNNENIGITQKKITQEINRLDQQIDSMQLEEFEYVNDILDIDYDNTNE